LVTAGGIDWHRRTFAPWYRTRFELSPRHRGDGRTTCTELAGLLCSVFRSLLYIWTTLMRSPLWRLPMRNGDQVIGGNGCKMREGKDQNGQEFSAAGREDVAGGRAPMRRQRKCWRGFVKAMGGELKITARFPEGPVEINQFEDVKKMARE
jgi:hypothetical protein